MEAFKDDSDDSNLGQDYKSPIKPVKQYGRSNDSFLSRMKARNARDHRTIVDASEVKKASKLKASKKKQEQAASSVSASDLIEELECSQDMKKFIKDEFSRERALYNFLPDSQIARAIIHRFRTHIANSGARVKRAEEEGRKTVRRSPLKLSGGHSKKKASVDTDDNSEDDEVEISDFDDDANFRIPDAGSFSLSPSASQLKLSKNILMRFAPDQDSFEISDSSQESTKSSSKRKSTTVRKTPVKKRKSEKAPEDQGEDFKVLGKDDDSNLPVLVSPSISDGISLFPGQEERDPGPDDLVLRLARGITCGTCRVHVTPTVDGEDSLKICFGCRTIAYCSRVCQGKSWPRHKKLCKILGKLPNDKFDRKMQIITNEVIWEDKKIAEARAKEAKAKDKGKPKAEEVRKLRNLPSRKGVTINSQPEFAPSNEDLLTMDVQTRSPAKSILKKSSGLHVSIVLSSPPIKSKAQLRTEEGLSQDLGSQEPIQCTSGSSDHSTDIPVVKSNLLSELTSSGRGVKASISEETFQDVVKQMEVLHSPDKRSETGDTPVVNNNLESQDDELLKKMEEIHGSPPDDQFTLACLPPRDREGSPGPLDNLDSSSASSKDEKSKNQSTSTPVNSPGLVGEIRNKSLSRPTSRKASFPRRATPYPFKSLDKDQTEDENSGLKALRRKIDFTSVNEEESEDEEPNLRLNLATSADLEDNVQVADVEDNNQDPEKDSDGDVMMSASAASSGHEELPQSSTGGQDENSGPLSPSQEYVATFQVILVSAVCLNLIVTHLILLLLLFRI